MRRRALRLLLAAAAAIAVASCSLTRLALSNAALAYNNATPVAAWMVDDYVELTDAQKSWVRERLSATFAWHRAEELPEYRRFFERISAQVDPGIGVAEARAAQGELRARYQRLIDHLLPAAAQLLVQLDAGQIAQLERKFAAENRKIVKESVAGTPPQREARRAKRFVSQLEEWTGRLSEAQRALVASSVRSMPEQVDDRLADRKYRESRILELARSRPAHEDAIAALRRLMIDTESWRRPEYQQKLRQRDQQFFEMIAALSATLTDNQRARVQRRLRGLVRDITELTAAN